MNLHLAEIAKNVAPGAHAILVLDGAGWHVSRKLIAPDNISLLELLPYSPELNPIEKVWAYLRGTKAGMTLPESGCLPLQLLRAGPGVPAAPRW